MAIMHATDLLAGFAVLIGYKKISAHMRRSTSKSSKDDASSEKNQKKGGQSSASASSSSPLSYKNSDAVSDNTYPEDTSLAVATEQPEQRVSMFDGVYYDTIQEEELDEEDDDEDEPTVYYEPQWSASPAAHQQHTAAAAAEGFPPEVRAIYAAYAANQPIIDNDEFLDEEDETFAYITHELSQHDLDAVEQELEHDDLVEQLEMQEQQNKKNKNKRKNKKPSYAELAQMLEEAQACIDERNQGIEMLEVSLANKTAQLQHAVENREAEASRAVEALMGLSQRLTQTENELQQALQSREAEAARAVEERMALSERLANAENDADDARREAQQLKEHTEALLGVFRGIGSTVDNALSTGENNKQVDPKMVPHIPSASAVSEMTQANDDAPLEDSAQKLVANLANKLEMASSYDVTSAYVE